MRRKIMLFVVITAIASVTLPLSAFGQISLLHHFTGGPDDGRNPYGSLALQGTTMYGMTLLGGDENLGAIFSMDAGGNGFELLHEFAGGTEDGRKPYWSGLTLSGALLYGMTKEGGDDNFGVIFSVDIYGNNFTLLHEFSGGADDGRDPYGGLTWASNALYGMTHMGGDDDRGTVFSISIQESEFTLLHEFSGITDGRSPQGDLTLSGNTLYGMTYAGGASGMGVIFSIDTDGNNFDLLHEFAGYPDDGRNPRGALTLSGETLYGMAHGGGEGSGGVIFAVGIDGSGYTLLHEFSGGNDDGKEPFGRLLLFESTLYGMTKLGGDSDWGTIFQIGTDGSGFELLHEFAGDPDDGKTPWGNLALSGLQSNLYGMTYAGGISNLGVVFSLDRSPVELISLDASGYNMDVQVTWETASETECEGFYLWRANDQIPPPSPDDYARITDVMIPSEGNESLGASYSYIDMDVLAGTRYYYRLEVVDIHGGSTFHGPVNALTASNCGAVKSPDKDLGLLWYLMAVIPICLAWLLRRRIH
ncbi:choice-of-anchor tandem repeat GloVer-containing protein [Thermodesulfobacteriota bacterium]